MKRCVCIKRESGKWWILARQMCVDMYELGDQKESKEGKVLMTMKNGGMSTYRSL